MINKEYHRSWRIKKKNKTKAVKMSIIELFKEYDPITEDMNKLINLLSLIYTFRARRTFFILNIKGKRRLIFTLI